MLTQAIDDYLAIRRAAGFRLAVTEALLRNYARFAAVRSETLIRSETVLAWAARAPSPPQRGRRLEVLSIFARHVHAEDPRHEIPPKGVFHACRPSYTPFIYTPAQIGALLARTAQLPPAGSLRPWTYCTLFALLAVTGLRISEALNLHLDDVTADGLLIRETKFHKSRWVPLHPSADAGLERYLERRRSLGEATTTSSSHCVDASCATRSSSRPFLRFCAPLDYILGQARGHGCMICGTPGQSERSRLVRPATNKSVRTSSRWQPTWDMPSSSAPMPISTPRPNYSPPSPTNVSAWDKETRHDIACHHVSAFLRERLPLERGASERTCDTYALALRLFLEFAAQRLKVKPSALLSSA